MIYPNTRKGFTLLELLVVVVIIGILAAVALPQYRKAVEKSRMVEAITAVEAIAKANEIYKLVNGTYTNNINNLDINFSGKPVSWGGDIPAIQGKYFILSAGSGDGAIAAIARIPRLGKYTMGIYPKGNIFNNHLIEGRVCGYYSGASIYERQLCQAWAEGK